MNKPRLCGGYNNDGRCLVVAVPLRRGEDGLSYTGSTPVLGTGRLGSIPSSPT